MRSRPLVWRLDRLGRDLPALVRIVSELQTKGVGFKSLIERSDMVTATGELVALSAKPTQTDRLGCVRQCGHANEKTDTLFVGRENGHEQQPRA